MENTKRMEELKKEFMVCIEPHIEEGIEIIVDYYISNGGYMRDDIYQISNGKKSEEGIDKIIEILKDETVEEKEDAILDYIEESFAEDDTILSSYRKIKLRISKGKELIVQVVKPKELIEDIRRTQLECIEREDLEKVIDEVEYTECDYDPEKTTCIINQQSISREETTSGDYSLAIKDYEYLYYILEGQINELRVEVTRDNIIIQADMAFPEWGIELIQKESVEDIDGSDIKKVYEYLESGEEQKIIKAVEVVKCNNELKSKIEKRYINLIRARLNSQNATIEDFSKEILTEKDRRTLLGENLSKSFISYSYMYDNETKMIVDYIGAMVKNHLDIEEFITKAKETTSEEEIKILFDTYSRKLREDILNETQNYKEGWYGEICIKFLDMELEKVMFDHTGFYEANESIVLREYMFFLGMIAKEELYMDIFQSAEPDLTEVFWMLKKIPRTNWSDGEAKFPKFSLSYKRDGWVKCGDERGWGEILNGFPSHESHRNYYIGMEYYDDNNYDEAIKYFSKSIDYGEDGRSYYERGVSYSNKEEYEKAFDDLNHAVRLGFDVEDQFYGLGMSCYYDKEYEKAIKYFTRAIEFTPNENVYYSTNSYYQRGICYCYLSENNKALNDVDKAIEIGGEKSNYLYSKAYILSQLKKFDESISLFNQVIEMKPSIHNYKNRGYVYKKMGQYRKFVEDFTSAIEKSSDIKEKSQLLVERAGGYKLLNDLDNVWKDLLKAIKVYPDNAAIYLDTIELYITTSNPDKGLEYIQKHERKILENCEERQRLIFLYLKAMILITLDISIEDFREELYTLAKKRMKLFWYFGHTNEWLEESDLSQDKKDEIVYLTDVVEGRK